MHPFPVLFKEWNNWATIQNQRIARTEIENTVISTIFIGKNNIFWETFISSNDHDGFQVRYQNKEEAINGHVDCIAMIKGELAKEIVNERYSKMN